MIVFKSLYAGKYFRDKTNMFCGLFLFVCSIDNEKKIVEIFLDDKNIFDLTEFNSYDIDSNKLKSNTKTKETKKNSQSHHHSEPVYFLKVLENFKVIAEKLRNKLSTYKEKKKVVKRCIFVGASYPNTVCSECQHCVIGFQIKFSEMFKAITTLEISQNFKVISFIAGSIPYSSEMKKIKQTCLDVINVREIKLKDYRFIQTIFVPPTIDILQVTSIY
eukprot:gene4131-7441_t